MATKVVLAALVLVVNSASVLAGETRVEYSSVQNFKNYALSTCIADGYVSDEVKRDGAAAARAYLEFGSLPLEAHTEATNLGRQFLKKVYPSMSGEPLVLMKCIDFYHSKELDRLARKYRGK